MQPAATVSWRGLCGPLVVMALGALMTPHSQRFVAMPTVWSALEPTLIIPSIPPSTATMIDTAWRWERADHLARVIAERRYAEIEAALAAIDPQSPYMLWVPAALSLAVEQLDATATAYAQMGMCRELGRFMREIQVEWPRGRAAMKLVSCESGAGRVAIGELDAASARRAWAGDLVIHGDRFGEITQASVSGDYRAGLASCGALERDERLPATCLVLACRAWDLPTAEVLHRRLADERDPYRLRRTTDPDYMAEVACRAAGVRFERGIARGDFVWLRHPVDLVRAHPDAPAIAGD